MKTAHRNAARAKRQQLPKFWRGSLNHDQQIDCKLIHWDLIDRFVNGTATSGDLWDWVETGATYSQMFGQLRRSTASRRSHESSN